MGIFISSLKFVFITVTYYLHNYMYFVTKLNALQSVGCIFQTSVLCSATSAHCKTKIFF